MGTKNTYLNAIQSMGGADEEYTTYETVDAGLSGISGLLRGKSVYCNCDNPFESQFVAWLVNNFERVGIKRLEATCFAWHMEQMTIPLDAGIGAERGGNADGALAGAPESRDGKREPTFRSRHVDGTAWHAVVTRTAGALAPVGRDRLTQLYRMPGNSINALEGNGGFETMECMEILSRSDIILTNPPFSKIRDMLRTLILHGKEFAVIGDLNAASYRQVFELLRAGKVWLGPVPAYWFTDAYGQPFRLKSGVWYTNMGPRPEGRYQGASGGHFWEVSVDGVMDVPRLSDFPSGHKGQLGVPLSWLKAPDPDYEMLDARPLRIRRPDGAVKKTYQRLIVQQKSGAPGGKAKSSRGPAAAAHEVALDCGGQMSFSLDGL